MRRRERAIPGAGAARAGDRQRDARGPGGTRSAIGIRPRRPLGHLVLAAALVRDAHRRDCRYALQLYALRPDGSSVAIKNVRANHHCPGAAHAQASSWPRPRSYDLGGATRIVQRVVCVGASSHQFCSARGLNYFQTFTAEATVSDFLGPAVSILADGPLARGEWVSGMQSVGYEASDNVGVKGTYAEASGIPDGHELRACDYAQRTPCPNGPGRIAVDTRPLPEGSQELHVTAEDAAGNSADSPSAIVRIDNTPPGAVPVGVGGGEAAQPKRLRPRVGRPTRT